MARSLPFRSPPVALAALLLLLATGTALGAQRAPKTKPAPTASASSQTLFSTNWSGAPAGQLPAGVTLVAGTAQVTTAQGGTFLQVSDSASLDLQLSGQLPQAYTIELTMQVPASTGYPVEIRPEAAAGSPAGYATLSRRTQNPVVHCGAIGSGIYTASSANDQLKRYPNTDAAALRQCKVEVDSSGVRVSFAGLNAAKGSGLQLGPGTVMRLHIPASASQPALIGNITIAAAAGSSVAAVASQTPTPTVPARFLELDAGGTVLERVYKAEGGDPVADVLESFSSAGVQMQPGTVRYSEIVARVPVGSFSALVDRWLKGITTLVNGRMIGVDYTQKPQYQRSFSNARLTEIAFPALDTGSQDAGYLELHLSPPSTQLQPGGTAPPLKNKPPVWLVRDFSLSAPGLDTKHVQRIEPFHIVLKKTTGPQPGGYIAGTRLTVTLGSSSAASWMAWQEDFLVKTKGSPERTLTLEFLDGAGNPLLKLEGNGVGLLSVRPIGEDASSQSLTRYKAELYVERWKILP